VKRVQTNGILTDRKPLKKLCFKKLDIGHGLGNYS
jgi:hypothetical protein